MAKKEKVIALLSDGLDSTLAIRLMLDQGLDVVVLHFVNPFTNPESVANGPAARIAKQLGVKLRIELKGQDFIELLRHPRHGFGSALNPCIDCRIHLLTHAKRIMEEEGAVAIITGEVIGQRPMSQMRPHLDLVERRAGIEGRLLRPLCAKLLPPTQPEIEGLIDRDKLLDFQGRGRKRQMELAKKYGLHDIQSGGPGCLLTDKMYAQKLQDLYDHRDQLIASDFQLLNVGRHFRLDSETKAIVGRDEKENDRLGELLRDGQVLFSPIEIPGPSILLEGEANSRNLRRIWQLFCAYSKSPEPDMRHAMIQTTMEGDNQQVDFSWEQVEKSTVANWRIV